MKRIMTSAVLLVFLMGNFHTGLVWINYSLQKSTITKLFCVNKSKPELHCEGKCHVQKILQEDENEEGVPSAFELRFLDPCIIVDAEVGHESTVQQYLFPLKITTDFHSHLSGVFHPPKAVC